MDILEVLSFEKITAVGIMIVAVWYFWSENKRLKKRIRDVIDKHETDLKENNKDMKWLIQKYNDFTNEMKDLIRPR